MIESLEQSVALLEKTLAYQEECHCTGEKTHQYITNIYQHNNKLVMDGKAQEAEVRSLKIALYEQGQQLL